MSNNPKYDVVVVGAGPSGSSFAYNLKKLRPESKILLLDKSEFPRYKPCGGGVSPEVSNYFDFDLTEAIDFICDDVVMEANNQEYCASGQYPLWMVRREKFDKFLLEKSRAIGVEIITNCEVKEVTNDEYETITHTSCGNFTSTIVILAHGSLGKIAANLGVNLKNKVFAALEYEHYTDKLDGKLYINLDKVPSGYAWNFPKSDGISIGAGGSFKQSGNKGNLPNTVKNYTKELGVNEIDKKCWHGHPIEAYSGKKNLVYNRVLLVGEIAGCVDPLTAEGIRPAIKSGYLASNVVAEFLGNSSKLSILKKYNKVFHKEIGKDFQYARIFAYFLYKFSRQMVPRISSTSSINGFMSVFSGKSTYREKIYFKRILDILRRIFLNSKSIS